MLDVSGLLPFTLEDDSGSHLEVVRVLKRSG
jgi:hypothetical protein